MTGEWTTRRSGWPTNQPVWMIVACVLAGLTIPGVLLYQYRENWTALQRYYLGSYLRSRVLATGPLARLRRRGTEYRMIDVIDRKHQRPALNDEVDPLEIAGPNGEPETTYTLSQAGIAAGDKRLVWHMVEADDAKYQAFLKHWIYGDRSLWDLMRPACEWGGGVFLAGFIAAIPLERRRKRPLKQGRRVRGPELVTRYDFNRRRKFKTAVGFTTNEPCLWRERFFVNARFRRRVLIQAGQENKHMMVMGDQGSGKSTLLRELLMQLDELGETAIVYDPAREYVQRFYRPERGDIILNPLDRRSPYWSPGEELESDAEAATIAESVFPDQPRETPFFLKTPRKIFAQMLRHRMNAEQMLEIMCDGEHLNRLIERTELESMASEAAPQQREGVRGSLTQIADALRLLKTKEGARSEGVPNWTAREWSKTRQGWIFVTSVEELRAPLQPLISVWLDILVLRLMGEPAPGARRVWFVLDELASLQKLPQLATALTENRKSGNPVVIGFQGKAQIETLYGHMAEVMLSQPWTKIFLKTGEPNARKWISDAIGEMDWEWLRESSTSGNRGGRETKTYAVEKKTIPLALPSEIDGLPERTGYLKNGNEVVRISFPYLGLPKVQPDFLPRELPALAPLPALAKAVGHGSQIVKQTQTPKEHTRERKLTKSQELFFE